MTKNEESIADRNLTVVVFETTSKVTTEALHEALCRTIYEGEPFMINDVEDIIAFKQT